MYTKAQMTRRVLSAVSFQRSEVSGTAFSYQLSAVSRGPGAIRWAHIVIASEARRSRDPETRLLRRLQFLAETKGKVITSHDAAGAPEYGFLTKPVLSSTRISTHW